VEALDLRQVLERRAEVQGEARFWVEWVGGFLSVWSAGRDLRAGIPILFFLRLMGG
jgi:hypothetical protein